MSVPTANADSAELEALFDSIAEQNKPAPASAPGHSVKPARKRKAKTTRTDSNAEVINQVGQMTRTLHDNLRALGYDRELDRAASSIPDARDRLAYVAMLTQQAADKVLNATDVAKPIQAALQQDAGDFVARWDDLFEGKLDVEAFKQLATQTRDFLKGVRDRAAHTDAQLTEIMLAQDFQDLTGQVLKKATDLVQQVESQLLNLLMNHIPGTAVPEIPGELGGPVIHSAGNDNVVTSQAQVDALLASLGF